MGEGEVKIENQRVDILLIIAFTRLLRVITNEVTNRAPLVTCLQGVIKMVTTGVVPSKSTYLYDLTDKPRKPSGCPSTNPHTLSKPLIFKDFVIHIPTRRWITNKSTQ